MSNGSEACCALGICCPPSSAQQEAALTKIIIDKGGCPPEYASEIAGMLLAEFALAPRSLTPLINDIVAMTLLHEQHPPA